jgi:hypothetical protein
LYMQSRRLGEVLQSQKTVEHGHGGLSEEEVRKLSG